MQYQLLYHSTSTPEYYTGCDYPTIQVPVDGYTKHRDVKDYLLSHLNDMEAIAANKEMIDLIESDFNESEYVKAIDEAFEIKDLDSQWNKLLGIPFKNESDYGYDMPLVYSYFVLEITDTV